MQKCFCATFSSSKYLQFFRIGGFQELYRTGGAAQRSSRVRVVGGDQWWRHLQPQLSPLLPPPT